ncbi:RDD family protein [Streptomyces sp. bgisy084]|uniref:RDD family protein n=1 Tax=Streptomyces sp. bgisy084 TaxID=3413777 RepID=UPI003D758AE7
MRTRVRKIFPSAATLPAGPATVPAALCYAVAGAGFGLPFLNQVLLTRIAGASLGKFAVRTRVIRETDASRPRLPRLFRRWLGGYLFIVVWIIAACFEMEDDPEDFCGVRLVRRKDLRALVPTA